MYRIKFRIPTQIDFFLGLGLNPRLNETRAKTSDCQTQLTLELLRLNLKKTTEIINLYILVCIWISAILKKDISNRNVFLNNRNFLKTKKSWYLSIFSGRKVWLKNYINIYNQLVKIQKIIWISMTFAKSENFELGKKFTKCKIF